MRVILIVLMLVASAAAATAQQPTARDGAPSGKSARPSRQPEVPSGQATGEKAKRQAIARIIARSQKFGGETRGAPIVVHESADRKYARSFAK
jgi:hypothetical protein